MEVEFLDDRIRKFLLSQEPETETRVARAIARLAEYGHELRMPHSKYLGKKLFELRVIGAPSIRLFYIFKNNHVLILHGYVKKSQTIPQKELHVARERQRLLEAT